MRARVFAENLLLFNYRDPRKSSPQSYSLMALLPGLFSRLRPQFTPTVLLLYLVSYLLRSLI